MSKESVKDRSQPSTNGCMVLVLAHFLGSSILIVCVCFSTFCAHMFYKCCIFFKDLSHVSQFLQFQPFQTFLKFFIFFTDLQMFFTIVDPFIFFTVVLYGSTFFFVALVQMVLLFCLFCNAFSTVFNVLND